MESELLLTLVLSAFEELFKLSVGAVFSLISSKEHAELTRMLITSMGRVPIIVYF